MRDPDEVVIAGIKVARFLANFRSCLEREERAEFEIVAGVLRWCAGGEFPGFEDLLGEIDKWLARAEPMGIRRVK